METFLFSAIWGLLIGWAAVLLAFTNGRVMGMSGIVKGILPWGEGGLWRFAFLVGIFAGSLLVHAVSDSYAPLQNASIPAEWLFGVVIAGILVGVGTTLANGCTSGHAVCGIGRWSVRSIVATAIFLGFGMITASILHGYIL